jgi:RimJ/RimL family protein N-acetyltransferase
VTPPRTAERDVRARELRWSDFDALCELYLLLYEERTSQPDVGIILFGSQPSRADEVAWFSALYRRVLAGDAVAAVGERDGRAVGDCVVSRVGPSAESEQAHVGLLGILVHRDHRGHGVGRAMLARALDECRGKFELVELRVFSINTRARHLYEEFGFQFVGRLPRMIRRNGQYYDEDVMVLDLASRSAKH